MSGTREIAQGAVCNGDVVGGESGDRRACAFLLEGQGDGNDRFFRCNRGGDCGSEVQWRISFKGVRVGEQTCQSPLVGKVSLDLGSFLSGDNRVKGNDLPNVDVSIVVVALPDPVVGLRSQVCGVDHDTENHELIDVIQLAVPRIYHASTILGDGFRITVPVEVGLVVLPEVI